MEIFEKLGIDLWVFLFHLINLAIIVFFAWFFLRKPVRKLIQSQNKTLSDVADENKKLNAEAEENKKSFAAIETHAKQDALRITNDAVQTANAKSEEIIEKAHAQAKGILDAAATEALAERERGKDEYRRVVTDMSLEIAEKILAREFSQSDNKKVVDDCIKELLS